MAAKRSIHGITVTENQYRVMSEAQVTHDAFCAATYVTAENACAASQKNLDELWRKVCEEGYAK